MFKSISGIGYWWLPDQDDNTITGKFDFSTQEGATLTLFGHFNNKNENLPNVVREFQSYDIINGWLDGKEFTLIKCSQIGATMNEITLAVKYVLTGDNIQSMDEIKFFKFRFSYTHLNYWFRLNTLNYNVKEQELKILNRDPIKLYETDDFILNLYKYTKSNMKNIGGREFSFKESCYLEIITKKENWSLEYVLNIIYRLQNLFVIFMGIPIYPDYIKGYKTDKYLEFPEGNKNYTVIEILYKIGLYQKIKNYRDESVIINYDNNKVKMESIIKSWFDREELLRPIYNLFLSLYFNPTMYQQNKFINLSQSAEIYHRRTRDNSFIDPAEFAKNKKEVIDSIPEEHKNWIKSRLTNEPSATERLSRLLAEFSFLDETLMGDLTVFKRNVRDTRNYLIHFNEDLKYKIVDSIELHKLIGKLKLLLYCCVLHELSFTNEDINKIILSNTILTSYREESESLF